MANNYYSGVVMADKPLRYYRLNETTGTVAYDLASGLNGTYTGGFTLGQAGPLQRDATDGGVKFNGTTGLVSLPATSLPTGNASWAWEAWVNIPSNPSTTGMIAGFGGSASHAAGLIYISNSGNVLVDASAGPSVTSSGAISLNTWHHVVGVYNQFSDVIALYVDNVFQGFQVGTGLVLGSLYASIGANGSPATNFLNGTVSEVSFYNYALSVQQVATHYLAAQQGGIVNLDSYSTAVMDYSPVAYFRGDDPVGSPNAIDVGPYGRLGTFVGGKLLGQQSLLASGLRASTFFDGTSGAMTFPVTGLPSGNQPFSIKIWLYCLSYNAGGATMIGFGAPGGSGNYVATLSLTSSGQVQTQSGGTSITVSKICPLNSVHFMTVTWDGTNWNLYFDGVVVGSQTPGSMAISTTNACIGAKVDGTLHYFNGYLAEGAIFNYALTAYQVMDLYQRGTSTPYYTVGGSSVYPLKTQIVKVFNPSGVFVDELHDAPLLVGFKEALNSAPTPIKVKLPRKIDSFDEAGGGGLGTIGQGNILQWWLFGLALPPNGLLRFQGVIDSYQMDLNEASEESVTLSVTPYGATVGDGGPTGSVAFGTPGSSGTYVDPITMARYFFYNNDPDSALPYTYPLIPDIGMPTSSGNASQYTFVNQGLDTVFDTIRLLLPANWYWRINENTKSVMFNVPPATAQHQFIIGRHIATPQFKKDWEQLRNVVQVIGSTSSITSTKKGTDLTTYGKRLLQISDNRVLDSNTAATLALAALAELDAVQYRFKIRVFDFRGDSQTGLGYDIETIQVGNTCQIIDPAAQFAQTLWDGATWDSNTWDFAPGAAFQQVVTIVSLSYGFDYVDLELGAFAPNQDRSIIELRNDFETFSTA